MMRGVIYFSIGVAITLSAAVAGDYTIIYQERIAGAEGFTELDPMMTEANQLLGFVVVDSAGHQVLIDSISSPTQVILQFDDAPMAVANRWSTDRDSLILYVIHGWIGCLEGPNLSVYTMIADSVVRRTFVPEYNGHWCFETFIFNDMRFTKTDDQPLSLVFESTMLYYDYWFTMGPLGGKRSTATEYSLDLNNTIRHTHGTRMAQGDLRADSSSELAIFINASDWWDFRDGPDDPNWGDIWGTRLSVYSADSNAVWTISTTHGESSSLFVDDFVGSEDYDEVIYYGRATDLLQVHGDPVWHIACYSFAGEEPAEVWYHPLSGVTLDHVFNPQHYIAGMRGKNKMIALDYRTGMLSDSVSLDRDLENIRFFETNAGLNLVGRSHDTIFVYQFDTPTDIHDQGEPILPTSFCLHQNYPNPFNPSTTIRYSLPERSHVTLSIFNILGQMITSLINEEKAADTHEVTWNARGLASGIYLYRLTAGDYSETRKMILMK